MSSPVRLSTWIFMLLGGSTLGLAGGVTAHAVMPESPVARGLFIGERRLPDDVSPASWLARRNEDLASRTVVFRHGEQHFEATLGEVGIEIDLEATLREAEAVGHEGGLIKRLRAARDAKLGLIDVPLAFRVSDVRARTFLESIAPSVRREPVDAKLDMQNLAKIPDEPGEELDVDATLRQLMLSKHDDGDLVDIVTRPIEARVKVADLVDVDISKVLSSFETTFHTWGSGRGRAANIRQAASYLTGTILLPGDTLSFNERVGPRTLERGFAHAPEIQGDELTTGVGGGTCQVSSTLHAAAIFGALEITDRQAHSRPSDYTKLGLDATVSYPSVDLQIKNPLPFAVMIHAHLPKDDTIRVDILGGEPIAEVEYKYGIARIEEFLRRITVKSHLPAGTKVRRQKGTRGLDVTSVVTIKYLDGRTAQRTYFSGYRPSPEVFWVAPGYDESELPALPKYARGIEGRESEIYGM